MFMKKQAQHWKFACCFCSNKFGVGFGSFPPLLPSSLSVGAALEPVVPVPVSLPQEQQPGEQRAPHRLPPPSLGCWWDLLEVQQGETHLQAQERRNLEKVIYRAPQANGTLNLNPGRCCGCCAGAGQGVPAGLWAVGTGSLAALCPAPTRTKLGVLRDRAAELGVTSACRCSGRWQGPCGVGDEGIRGCGAPRNIPNPPLPRVPPLLPHGGPRPQTAQPSSGCSLAAQPGRRYWGCLIFAKWISEFVFEPWQTVH